MRFEVDWASFTVGSKFTVFALFYFVLEDNFPSASSRGAYIWRGDLTEGFCVRSLGGLYLEGLIHGGNYFRNFTVFHSKSHWNFTAEFTGRWLNCSVFLGMLMIDKTTSTLRDTVCSMGNKTAP